jgi:hypothetical protein
MWGEAPYPGTKIERVTSRVWGEEYEKLRLGGAAKNTKKDSPKNKLLRSKAGDLVLE